jgi:hypothetical protein
LKQKTVLLLLLIITFSKILSCGTKQQAIPVDYLPFFVEQTEIEISRAEEVVKALMEAYPDRIEKVEFRNGDWALLLRDKWYYFADGRLLTEDRLKDAANYRALLFYGYPEELPAWENPGQEEVDRFIYWRDTRSQSQVRRSGCFLDSLWYASSRAEVETHIVRVNFLGWQPRVHRLIQNKLMLVEQRIRSAAQTDAEVQAWIRSIGTLDGYNWRTIADTGSRSYHSYGLAIDILPRSLGNLQSYWLWTARDREDWWNVSYNERYHPPAAVIKAFETYGFIWGGKWPLYDTMHFEYRPEILILSGMAIERE